MLDKLQIVAGPGFCVRLQCGEPIVEIGGLEVGGHKQHIDIRVLVGLASSDGPEKPGADQVLPLGYALAQSADEFAAQTRQGDDGWCGEI